jgi:hypothetical protein
MSQHRATRIWRALAWAVAIGALLACLMMVPFAALLGYLIAWPLCEFRPDFCANGPHIDVGFAWLTYKSIWGFLPFWLYFSAVAAIPMLLWALLARRKQPVSAKS